MQSNTVFGLIQEFTALKIFKGTRIVRKDGLVGAEIQKDVVLKEIADYSSEALNAIFMASDCASMKIKESRL
ncbi:hypothetical protein AB6A40_007262 [Gnathostoma spinigerum]|uniref:Uncharacterized protein n=1 Tax=Gnathostoma spinigerum TaxID=75299 RepID=A0ABD6EKZ7_9BILA